MKKLFLLSLILLVIVAFRGLPAMADPVTEQLFQSPYVVALGEETYQLSFMQGPFGPGYGGLTVLSGPNVDTGYSFMEERRGSGLIRVYGLGDFYFAGDELVWIESTFLTLKAQSELEMIQIE